MLHNRAALRIPRVRPLSIFFFLSILAPFCPSWAQPMLELFWFSRGRTVSAGRDRTDCEALSVRALASEDTVAAFRAAPGAQRPSRRLLDMLRQGPLPPHALQFSAATAAAAVATTTATPENADAKAEEQGAGGGRLRQPWTADGGLLQRARQMAAAWAAAGRSQLSNVWTKLERLPHAVREYAVHGRGEKSPIWELRGSVTGQGSTAGVVGSGGGGGGAGGGIPIPKAGLPLHW
jgi:hypothetical protein